MGAETTLANSTDVIFLCQNELRLPQTSQVVFTFLYSKSLTENLQVVNFQSTYMPRGKTKRDKRMKK